MVLDVLTLIFLIVFGVVGIVLITYCIYCCTCKPAWANTRHRLITQQIARDEEATHQERAAYRDEIKDKLSTNQQMRNDIREKYQL